MIACDILTIPVTIVGVERLFNRARDLCHYRRGHLNAESIRASMIVKEFDRIELINELESVKEADPFVALEFDCHEVEREESPSYISDDEATEYSSDTGFPSAQLPT